jgi:8-oxo-dGTP pyrophosphatase MutT (NUDIX family)
MPTNGALRATRASTDCSPVPGPDFPMSTLWKPSTTVAAVVEREGRFLVVEENTVDGLRLNQPAGHLDPGESLLTAVAREALEETACRVEPEALIGIYMTRFLRPDHGIDVVYLRFAFACRWLGDEPWRALDAGIERAVWMSADELRAAGDRHRSPLVMRSVDDYLAGRRYPLALIHTDPSCLGLAERPC